MDVLTSIEALLAFSALAGALGLLLRKVWRGVRKLSHIIDDTLPRVHRAVDDVIGDDDNPGMTDRLKTLEQRQLEIAKELYPNGGSSMRDSLTRVEASLQAAKETAAKAAEIAGVAADEVARVQEALGEANVKAGRERSVLQDSLNVLLSSLADFSQESRMKELAYVRALNSLGIDLKPITDELD